MAYFTETTFLNVWKKYLHEGYPLPDLNARTVRLCVFYLNAIHKNKAVYRLTSAETFEEYVDIFLLRPALLLPALFHYECEKREGYDIGTGAGTPGIGLKLLGWNGDITLVERSVRKCTFLRFIVSELRLEGEINIVNEDARTLSLNGGAWVTAQGVNIVRQPLLRKVTRWIKKGIRIFWITHPVRESVLRTFHLPVKEYSFPHPHLTLYVCG